MKEVYEGKQVKEAYKLKNYPYQMIKMLYRTSLFLMYKVLQIPWYQLTCFICIESFETNAVMDLEVFCMMMALKCFVSQLHV